MLSRTQSCTDNSAASIFPPNVSDRAYHANPDPAAGFIKFPGLTDERNSGAEAPSSIIGRTVEVSGVFGRFLDVLVVTRPGDTTEFECKHDGQKQVVHGELLRKVAPYDPADYPTLPEYFRGFVGTVVGDIQKKDAETFEPILKVSNVLNTSDHSKAKNPQSIDGRSLMLAGFLNRRDACHNLRPRAEVLVGVKHIGLQQRTPHRH